MSLPVVQRWLRSYADWSDGDRPEDATPVNSSPKSADGVTGTQLNKIMIDQAVASLPDLVQACVKARWLYRLPKKTITQTLRISDGVYYARCEEGVRLIHKHVNGKMYGTMRLLEKIEEGR